MSGRIQLKEDLSSRLHGTPPSQPRRCTWMTARNMPSPTHLLHSGEAYQAVKASSVRSERQTPRIVHRRRNKCGTTTLSRADEILKNNGTRTQPTASARAKHRVPTYASKCTHRCRLCRSLADDSGVCYGAVARGGGTPNLGYPPRIAHLFYYIIGGKDCSRAFFIASCVRGKEDGRPKSAPLS